MNDRKREIVYSVIWAVVICGMWYLSFRLGDEDFYFESSLLYFLHQNSGVVNTVASIVSVIAIYIDWHSHSNKYLVQAMFAAMCFRLLFAFVNGFQVVDATFLLLAVIFAETMRKGNNK